MSVQDKQSDAARAAVVKQLRSGSDAPAFASELASLQQEFVRRHASTDDALAYATVDSPVGPLRLIVSARGVVRLVFESTEDVEAVMLHVAREVTPRILREPARTDAVHRELDEYFRGVRQDFDAPLDLRLAHGFRAEVLDHLRDVPFGATVSYTTLARSAGRPRAVRAAASACATNPLPILVPCHRVVRADGSLGGYLGGLDAKRLLLALEGTALA